MVGQRMTVEDVLAVVRRDLPFYEQSGGGMTLSGGEPLAQYDFSLALLTAAKAAGMHTALESTAYLPWERLQPLAALVDLFLIDLKHTDDARHRTLTGISNQQILDNIRRMVAANWPIHLRIPWVPTCNAEPAFLRGLIDFLTALLAIPPVTFLPYHSLGAAKWPALGGASPLPDDLPNATAEDIAPWLETLQVAGICATCG
jgi:pyruvate formate lyase activating enzyme